MSRILIVLSAASVWTRADGSKYDSGVWAEEFVVMHDRFVRGDVKSTLRHQAASGRRSIRTA
jgi:hypothetical protein